MIKLNQTVIVEGKYDKITLENIIDATIITTNGFGIFKDKAKCDLIRLLAEKQGIIVITDSDNAGMVIRSHLKQICHKGTVTNVYVPQLCGKEKRKEKFSKQGYLGVEGLDKQTILTALERSGVIGVETKEVAEPKISKTDLFALGLSGGDNSSLLREDLAKLLNLPQGMSANAFLDCINAVYGYNAFMEEVKKWQQDKVKK